MSAAASWIEAKAARSFSPARVENTLTALHEQWPTDARELQDLVEQFPLGEDALLHLLSVSSVCASRLIRDPQLLVWLAEPDVCDQRRSRRRMMADLRASSDNIS